MAYARGKYAKAISDRSGMEFPYREMVKEWNGLLVHKSEYEPKHPQIRRTHHKADAIALANPRPQQLLDTDVNLDPTQYINLDSVSQVPPESGTIQNQRRQVSIVSGAVTVAIS
tara:strand:- start:121 stop:462 length:342 start_codon:yes stop_codon:yes gene_type:complete